MDSHFNPFDFNSFAAHYSRSQQPSRQDDPPAANPSHDAAPAPRATDRPPRLPLRDNAFNMRALYDTLPGSQSARYSSTRIDRMESHSPQPDYASMLRTPVDELTRSVERETASPPPEARPGPSQSMRLPGERAARRPRAPFSPDAFVQAVLAWGNGERRKAAAQSAGIHPGDLQRYVGTDGLTDLGREYADGLSPERRQRVMDAAARRPRGGGVLRSLGRMFGLGGSSSRAAPPPRPPSEYDAPVQRERERSARWGGDVLARASSAGTASEPHLYYKYIMDRDLLEDYGRGVPMKELQKRFGAAFNVSNHFRAKGGLHRGGQQIFDELNAEDQETLKKAIEARQAFFESNPTRPAQYESIIGNPDFLEGFANDVSVSSLPEKPGFTAWNYFASDGSLKKPGQSFRKQLDEADRNRLDQACEDRKAIHRMGRDRFVKAAEAFANPGRSLAGAARKAGVQESDLRRLLTESGLTPRGRAYVETLDDLTQTLIHAHIRLRQEQLAQQAVPQQRGEEDMPVQYYDQDALWAALPQESGDPGPSAFPPPIQYPAYGGLNFDAPVQYYDQDALWAALTQGSEDPGSSAYPPSIQYPAYGGLHFNAPFESAYAAGYSGSGTVEGATGVGHHHTAPEIVDVDKLPSPQATTRPTPAQRLALDPWLGDEDFVNFNWMLAQRLAGQPNADQLSFVPPTLARALINEVNQAQWEGILRDYAGPDTPPILFVPVNDNNRHWSLLVVNRQTGRAYHYDSNVDPRLAHKTDQFGVANRMAHALGAGTPRVRPMARQRDGHSCGDFVMRGTEVLAQRIISGEIAQEGGMDLSTIRPDAQYRQYIVDQVTVGEQLRAAAP